MFGGGGGIGRKKSSKLSARQRASQKLVSSMDDKVTDGDKTSKELQHFWKIMLRGMQVRVLKRNNSGASELMEDFWVFWMNVDTPGGATLFLRPEKVAKPSTGVKAKFVRGRSMALHDLTEVRYGGLKVGLSRDTYGEEEDEDDEEAAAPALNKMIALHARDGSTIEFEITLRAAELLLEKFTIVIQALDMFEKVESQLELQMEVA